MDALHKENAQQTPTEHLPHHTHRSPESPGTESYPTNEAMA